MNNAMDQHIYDTWQTHVPADFAPDSRVWIYQANRRLGIGEALRIEPLLEDFVANWKSHGAPVKGFANLFFGQFLVLMADETATGVSGCSTDSSVRLVKELEQLLNISFFDRLMLAFLVKDKIEMLPMAQLNYAFEKGYLTGDSIYFNNLVQTKAEWLERWMLPVKESWLASRMGSSAV